MAPSNKRSKSKASHSPSPQPEGHADATVICQLTRMPLELLAEILSYMPSTRDVLALARTSKHFCTVLVNNESTEFIWRQARARCRPERIPDFTPNFTEASFAAFLFDPKVCEVCRKKTKDMYYSFALKATVCDKSKCLAIWRVKFLYTVTSIDEHHAFLQWIPRFERTEGLLHTGNIHVRGEDWQQAINEHRKVQLCGENALAAYTAEKQALADALPAKTELCKKLVEWSTNYERHRRIYAKHNLLMATNFAKENKWVLHDLLRTPSYSIMHNAKNRCVELVTEEACEALKKVVQSEVVEMKEKDRRREQEHALQERVVQVQTKWNDLKSTQSREQPPHAVPSLREFEKLSVIKIFKRTPSLGSSSNLEDPFVASVLTENIEQWRQGARAALAVVLGFSGWKPLSKRKLHPVDRLTARFRCQRCDDVAAKNGKKILEDGGMDFTQVCEHVCGHLQKKRHHKERWNAERFVPDRQAVDAISQVLSMCNASAEDVDSLRIVKEVGDRIQCQSCSCVMDVGSVARHCKRHVDCSFILLSSECSADPPIEHGLAKQLLKTMNTAEKDSRVYSCRHCLKAHAIGVASQVQQNKLFSFNGLRSHLKEKHVIWMIADEDFSRHKDSVAGASSNTE